ncbi:protein kinase domain protein [Ichthyophthirius multifiliis]|uniref:Protein kinase domain protein n=1 Tax=Ichthyophthirius multifiliis TaxID=5932 RepID=G0QWK1_ICHMU|nr:protein kinase domain protein [Ichthyophthirius multifiliis]EGR30396.1 protein kinase domain protein [Ichthyophthirius multifiliis]|eukprot:XP_004031983.1 protein kinase domain protein [Ichthyophthirius multifiliis]
MPDHFKKYKEYKEKLEYTPENIILDFNLSVKLCDFGWCTEDIENPRNSFCGTYEYMAPEIVFRQQYDYRIDIWALGILLYELLHGSAPFKGKSLNEIQQQIQKGDVIFSRSISVLSRSIISAKRTPIGGYMGELSKFRASDLLGFVLKNTLYQSKLDQSIIDEVILGTSLQASQGQNPAKQGCLIGGNKNQNQNQKKIQKKVQTFLFHVQQQVKDVHQELNLFYQETQVFQQDKIIVYQLEDLKVCLMLHFICIMQEKANFLAIHYFRILFQLMEYLMHIQISLQDIQQKCKHQNQKQIRIFVIKLLQNLLKELLNLKNKNYSNNKLVLFNIQIQTQCIQRIKQKNKNNIRVMFLIWIKILFQINLMNKKYQMTVKLMQKKVLLHKVILINMQMEHVFYYQ